MDPILGLLFIAGVLWVGKQAAAHIKADFRKSRAEHAEKAARAGTSPRHASRQHAAAWWAREAAHGFPVTRTGFHHGWLAHQTALDQRQAQREEARTSHLEARASIASEWAAHRRRQQEAQARIDQAREPAPGGMTLLTARSKSGRPVNRLTGEPEDTVAVHGKEDLDRRLAAAAEDPDIEVTTRPAPHLHAVTPPSPEGTQQMATATEGSYTTVLTAADNQAAQADYASADVASQRKAAEQILEEMQSANVDAASLSDQADHVTRLRAAEEALNQVTESGAQVSSGLAQRHGGIKEAHDDAPVKAAESGFYED